jgi:hypothetical protein
VEGQSFGEDLGLTKDQMTWMATLLEIPDLDVPEAGQLRRLQMPLLLTYPLY